MIKMVKRMFKVLKEIIIGGIILFCLNASIFAVDSVQYSKEDFRKKVLQIKQELLKLQASRQNLYFEYHSEYKNNNGEIGVRFGKTYRQGRYLIHFYDNNKENDVVICVINPQKESIDIYEKVPGLGVWHRVLYHVPNTAITNHLNGVIPTIPFSLDDVINDKVIRLHQEDIYEGRAVWITELIDNGQTSKYVFDQQTGLCLLDQKTDARGGIIQQDTITNIKLDTQEYSEYIQNLVNTVIPEVEKGVKKQEREAKIIAVGVIFIPLGSFVFGSILFALIYFNLTGSFNRKLQSKFTVCIFFFIWIFGTYMAIATLMWCIFGENLYYYLLLRILGPVPDMLRTIVYGVNFELLIILLTLLTHIIFLGILGILGLLVFKKLRKHPKTE